MTKSYPNERDCEHGSMRGKCDICEYEQDIKELEAKVAELEEWKKNACERMEGLSASIDGYVKRIAELEVEASQSDEILAEHDLINYEIIINQSERIAELEELACMDTLSRSLAIRDLEQQAKICEFLAETTYTDTAHGITEQFRLYQTARRLREQAEQLKEQQ